MNPFQWLTLPFVVAVLLWEVIDRRRWASSPLFWLVRCFVWVAAGVTIADPALVQGLASAVGIGRGADAVLYLFVLSFLATTFYFYSQKVALQRQVTVLVRHLAIREAARGPDGQPPRAA